ncbi:MAG: hypothetical protein E7425_03920 [Ruminococcaceae bacterium]|nr:hypothetical protein [Oscillospiraceae bacterium]
MRRLAAMLLSTALCLALFICPAARAAEQEETDAEYVGYLVSCPSAFLQESADAPLLRGGAAGTLEHVLEDIYWTQSESYALWLLESGRADFVEPNYVATLFDTNEGDAGGWQREALCSDAAEALGLDGTGVRVAVIDSGVDPNNPDLADAKLADGYDYIAGTTEMSDDVSHGTKVAQLLCGDDNNLGVTGLARGCELVPLRCFSKSHDTTVAELALAVKEAVTRYHCDVINMSWGLANDSQILHDALRQASDAGVALVAAAGNTGTQFPQGSLVYPAAYDEVISVASVNSSLIAAQDSMHNAFVTVCAPGADLSFTLADGSSASGSGTSFATPCVSALAALLKQHAGLSGADVLALLRERSVDLGDPGFDDVYGYGLPRLDALLVPQRCVLSGRTLSASLLRREGGTVVLALYDAQGRMTGMYLDSAADGYGLVRCAAADDAVSGAAFYLDESAAPIFAVDRVSLR